MSDFKGSPLKVFSIFQNVKTFMEGKDIENLQTVVSERWFDKSPEFLKIKCKSIFNDIENSYYNYNDLTIYILINYIYAEKFYIKKIENQNIEKIPFLFSEARYLEDQNFIVNLNKKVKLSSIEEYFNIRDYGESVIYGLIKDKHISPIFFLKLRKKIQFKDGNKSSEYVRFIRIINTLEYIIP